MQVNTGDERVQESDGIENVAAEPRMLLENLVLFGRQLAWLVQVQDATDLADVVHERALPDDLDVFGGEAEAAREERGVHGDAVGMARRVAVHLVDRFCESFDGLLERGPQVLVEPRVLDRGRGARADDGEELALPFVEALAAGHRCHRDEPAEPLLHPEWHGGEPLQGRLDHAVEKTHTARSLFDERWVGGEVRGKRLRLEPRNLGIDFERGIDDVLALAEASLPVVEPCGHEVGMHFVERAVGDGVQDLVER